MQAVVSHTSRDAKLSVISTEPGAALANRPQSDAVAAAWPPFPLLRSDFSDVEAIREWWRLLRNPVRPSQLESPGASQSPVLAGSLWGPATPGQDTTPSRGASSGLGLGLTPRRNSPLAVQSPLARHSTTPSASRRPLVTDMGVLQPGSFYDVVCQVVENQGIVVPSAIVVVTNYTFLPRPEMVHAHTADRTNWMGLSLLPAAMQIRAVFWDEVIPAAQSLHVGDVVLLRNVRAKQQGGGAALELVLHGERARDSVTTNRVQVLDATPGPANEHYHLVKTLERQRDMLVDTQVQEDVVVARPDRTPARARDEASGPAGAPSPKRARVDSSPERSPASAEDDNTLTEFATVTCHAYIPATPLAEVIGDERVPYKYRCRVRFVGIQPARLAEMTRLVCIACNRECPRPQEGSDAATCSCGGAAAWVYRFAVTVTDGSGAQVQVLVAGERGAALLAGIPPTDLTRDGESAQRLLSRLAFVLYGLHELDPTAVAAICAGSAPISSLQDSVAERNAGLVAAPWCDVCMLGYLASADPSEAMDSDDAGRRDPKTGRRIRYQFFDTSIPDP
ncbi:3-ketoacyl-CoA thiolase with broad chain length specificity [Blastocladiella emersonii ATCC 22665]|nr:3-ketoacyl-CoA thiolase with broad chain length specificity [Blastocladiella emersonii ATCC 22665]